MIPPEHMFAFWIIARPWAKNNPVKRGVLGQGKLEKVRLRALGRGGMLFCHHFELAKTDNNSDLRLISK
jgi:hypothetical protein